VLEATRVLAAERGIIVTGSEIVGMVPFPAILEAGKYYLTKQGRSVGIPIKDILETAVQSLGLNDVSDFNIEERVIGLPQDLNGALVNMKVNDFIDEVSRESPAPGGGSVAALAGALGAALSSMVSNLTANNRGSEEVDSILNKAAEEAQEIKNALIGTIDKDTNAFNAYMEARRLPSNTMEEKRIKHEAEQRGLKEAVLVPLKTAQLSLKTIEISRTVVEHGNPNSITDVGVGAQIAFAGVKGGIYNVLINLKDIDDTDFIDEMKLKCSQFMKDANDILNKINKKIESVII
jgi:glutamate formiminotransferase/formiminotetrahydrofolate cyclodeaminase